MGSEAWNIADGYTKEKILKPLVQCDSYITIAKYGAEDLGVSLELPEDFKTDCRLQALDRLIDCLRKLITNSNALLKKTGQEEISKINEEIDKLEEKWDALFEVKTDASTNTEIKKINEEFFGTVLKTLRKVLKEITEPLNQSGLIFPTSEEIDLDRVKQELTFGG